MRLIGFVREQLKDVLLFAFSLEEIDSDRNVLPANAEAVQQDHPDQRNDGDNVTGDGGGGGDDNIDDSYISEISDAAHVR